MVYLCLCAVLCHVLVCMGKMKCVHVIEFVWHWDFICVGMMLCQQKGLSVVLVWLYAQCNTVSVVASFWLCLCNAVLVGLCVYHQGCVCAQSCTSMGLYSALCILVELCYIVCGGYVVCHCDSVCPRALLCVWRLCTHVTGIVYLGIAVYGGIVCVTHSYLKSVSMGLLLRLCASVQCYVSL